MYPDIIVIDDDDDDVNENDTIITAKNNNNNNNDDFVYGDDDAYYNDDNGYNSPDDRFKKIGKSKKSNNDTDSEYENIDTNKTNGKLKSKPKSKRKKTSTSDYDDTDDDDFEPAIKVTKYEDRKADKLNSMYLIDGAPSRLTRSSSSRSSSAPYADNSFYNLAPSPDNLLYNNLAPPPPDNPFFDAVPKSLPKFDKYDLGTKDADEDINVFSNISKVQTYKTKSSSSFSQMDIKYPKLEVYSFDQVCMGLRKFYSTSVQADYHGNQFILHVGFPVDELIDKHAIDIGEETEKSQGWIEYIPFDSITDMKLAPVSDKQSIFYLTVKTGTIFKTVVCGLNRTLNPDSDEVERKYIYLVGSPELCSKFQLNVNNFSQSLLHIKVTPKSHRILKRLEDIVNDNTDDATTEKEALRELDQFKRTCKRLEAGGSILNDQKKVFDPNDEKVYLIYPIEVDAIDAVTIYNGCLKKLNIPEYLNDNLIDWKIKHDIRIRRDQDENITKRIHAFSTMFFTKLTEVNDNRRGFAFVRKWTQNVDIFDKDFLFIPINRDLHWSLIVIVKPNLLKSDDDNNASASVNIEEEAFLENDDNGDDEPIPCILHMDSLNPYGHSGEKFAKTIRAYLEQEWEAKKGSKLTCSNTAIPFHQCFAPKQENSYDCGVYVIKYVEYILDHLNDIKPSAKSLKNKKISRGDNVITNNAFSQDNVTLERTKMRSLLEKIQSDWLLENAKNSKALDEDDSYIEIKSKEDIQEEDDVVRAKKLSLVVVDVESQWKSSFSNKSANDDVIIEVDDNNDDLHNSSIFDAPLEDDKINSPNNLISLTQSEDDIMPENLTGNLLRHKRDNVYTCFQQI